MELQQNHSQPCLRKEPSQQSEKELTSVWRASAATLAHIEANTCAVLGEHVWPKLETLSLRISNVREQSQCKYKPWELEASCHKVIGMQTLQLAERHLFIQSKVLPTTGLIPIIERSCHSKWNYWTAQQIRTYFVLIAVGQGLARTENPRQTNAPRTHWNFELQHRPHLIIIQYKPNRKN